MFYLTFVPKTKKYFSSRIEYTTRQNVLSVMYELRSEKQLSIEHRVYNIQQCAFCKLRVEAKEIAQKRSYNAKYRNQAAEFRWVLLTLIEDHDIASRGAQKLYHSVLWGILLVIYTTSFPKHTTNIFCSHY